MTNPDEKIEDFDRQHQADRDLVQSAIRAIRKKGWDINPYTIADEVGIAPSSIFRSRSLMELIIRERGGTFGVDLRTAVDLAAQIHELERRNLELKDKLKQYEGLDEDDHLSAFRKLKLVGGKQHLSSHEMDLVEDIENLLPEETEEEVAEGLFNSLNFDVIDEQERLTQPEVAETVQPQMFQIDTLPESEMTADELGSLIFGEALQELLNDRIKQQTSESATAKNKAEDKGLNKNKFVGTGKSGEVPTASPPHRIKTVPPEIRKACLILGVRVEDITETKVQEAWKRQLAKPGVHPDLGGDNESAIYLNTAKDTLVDWLEDRSPKLGKLFGQQLREE